MRIVIVGHTGFIGNNNKNLKNTIGNDLLGISTNEINLTDKRVTLPFLKFCRLIVL